MDKALRVSLCVASILVWACGGDDGATDASVADPGRDLVPADLAYDAATDTTADRPGADPGLDDTGLNDLAPTDAPAIDLAPFDPGTADTTPVDPGIPDPGPVDPGTPDPGATDTPALGTKTAGELCKTASECSMSMDCIQGQFTPAHCNIQCSATEQCLAIAPGTAVTCQAIGGTGVCMWTCNGGAKCPGGLTCDGWFCG